MTVAIPYTPVPLLTYESYMAEPYIEGSYDIVEGVKNTVPGASWEHQAIVGNLFIALRSFQHTFRQGRVVLAPFDVLIRRLPRLTTRQPDLFFVSQGELSRCGGIPRSGPLIGVPELVLEVISDSETATRVEAKLRDYHEIGVQEVWRVWPQPRQLEVLRHTRTGCQTAALYEETDTLVSASFPDLQLTVASVFADLE